MAIMLARFSWQSAPATAALRVEELLLHGDRAMIRRQAASAALELLADALGLTGVGEKVDDASWRLSVDVLVLSVRVGRVFRMRSQELPVKPVLVRELIGESLREERVSQGKTLRDVSRKARVSLGYLSEVERGQKEASSELLAAICAALDLPLSVFSMWSAKRWPSMKA
jgi:hypothetical protein